jgi:DNA-binding SARP family transcriptional activator
LTSAQPPTVNHGRYSAVCARHAKEIEVSSTPTLLTTSTGARARLSLLGGFSLRVGDTDMHLPTHARRGLAYLALDRVSENDCDRGVMAERLWPDATPDRSRASLRTALWCLRRVDPALVAVNLDRLRLADDVDVDLHTFRSRAERILANGEGSLDNYTLLVGRWAELLPGWTDPWLALAREQLRQLRLHAMEAAARELGRRGRIAEAIDVLLTVIAEEPLRESAQTGLIDAHLREGNVFEARRQFQQFVELLWTTTGLRPAPALFRKVGAALPVPVRREPDRRAQPAPARVR